MSNIYTWTVTSMQCYPEYESKTDVVFNVFWTASGTDGITTASLSNETSVSYVAGSPYTPYADLTNDQVIGWVQAVLGENGTQAVETALANQIAKPVVTPPLPWI